MHEAFLSQQKYTDEEAIQIIAAKEQASQTAYESALKKLGLDKDPLIEQEKPMNITDARPPDEMRGEQGINWDDLAGKLGV